MSKSDNAPVNATELLRTISVFGANYTNSRHALIAHLITTGVKPSLIVTEGKVSPQEVSRIVKILKEMNVRSAAYKFVATLNIRALRDAMTDPLSPVLAEIAKHGEAFKATKRNGNKGDGKAGAKKLPTADSGTVRIANSEGKAEDVEIIPVFFDWLTADYANRLPLVTAMLADADAHVARLAAEADEAADAA